MEKDFQQSPARHHERDASYNHDMVETETPAIRNREARGRWRRNKQIPRQRIDRRPRKMIGRTILMIDGRRTEL